MTVTPVQRTVKIQARQWLFPLAACYALLVLPLTVLGLLGQLALPAGLANPLVHAHELLFGLAFLVVYGYLLGPMRRIELTAFIVLWLLARCSFAFHPFSWPATIFSMTAALFLGYRVVPRFWRAQKWRNQSVAVIVALFVLLAGLAGHDAHWLQQFLPSGLLVLAALMYFMGGRVIAPVLAGYWLQQKVRMENRVQPGLEGAGLIGFALALLLQVAGGWPALLALVLGTTGIIVWLRLLRWQPWKYWRRLDIVWLFFGYGCLGAALLLMAGGQFWPLARLLATHVLTVGAMGVLMVSIMARVVLVKRFKDANALPSAHVASGLLVLAAVLRFLAPLLPTVYTGLVHAAMLCWMLGFACLLWLFWRCRENP